MKRMICQLCMICGLFFAANAWANPSLWTEQGARLTVVAGGDDSGINWVFLSEPGVSSPSFSEFTRKLRLPGTTWLLNLPGDANNRLSGHAVDYTQWTTTLVQAVSTLDHVVLVAHSVGGMLALSAPDLQKHLDGLVLMNTAPSAAWMSFSTSLAAAKHWPNWQTLTDQYLKNPNDQDLKQLMINLSPYFFDAKHQKIGRNMLAENNYYHAPYDFTQTAFNPTYHAQWIPKNMPVLIIGGDTDSLMPIDLFSDNPLFHKPHNIYIRTVSGGHFPWMENLHGLQALFLGFEARVTAYSYKNILHHPTKALKAAYTLYNIAG